MRSIPLFLFSLFYVGAAATLAAPGTATSAQTVETSKRCPTLRVRREWRAMKDYQKRDYIRAVRCLQTLPARNIANPVVQTRFDELQEAHISFAERVHSVGHFLPWHRYLTKIHENILRDECQYRGPIPYWDWSKDADALTHTRNSPVFDPVTGFGGNGVPNTYTLPADFNSLPSIVPINPNAWRGCVRDGPFANHTLVLGPGKMVTEHCLVRSINETYRQYLTSSAVRNATRQPTFELFRIELEGRPVTPTPKMHDAAHVLVGGDMSNFYSAAGDPLFFLHHANLDRIWWVWQQINPAKRLYEISGRSTVAPPYRNVTLDYILDFGALSPSLSVREVMNIHARPSCYTYV